MELEHLIENISYSLKFPGSGLDHKKLKKELQQFYNEALQVGFELGKYDYEEQLYYANCEKENLND